MIAAHYLRQDHHHAGRCLAYVLLALCILLPATAWADPLPSWTPGERKRAIIDFVEAVSDPDSTDFIAREKRIAVFDHDGTLCTEQPAYLQVLYALDRVKGTSVDDNAPPLHQAATRGDLHTLLEAGESGIDALLSLAHQDRSLDAYTADVSQWLSSATHPSTARPYSEMVYQPILELLSYLRDRGFSTYIVSGGGLFFLRTFAEGIYGIPPHQIIGSTGGLALETDTDGSRLVRRGRDIWIDDGAHKVVAIERHIGQRPILAVGNSDGDVPMLAWATQGQGPHLALLIHHTDAEREFAYDRHSLFGHLKHGLDEAAERHWQVVDMATDWQTIYPEVP